MRTALFVALSGLLLIAANASKAQTGAETDTVDAWRRKIAVQLESKRYFPPEAMGEGGTAKVKFAFDRLAISAAV